MKIRQLFYTLLKKGIQKIFFCRGKKFLFPLFSKMCIKKLKCQQQKIWFLVFRFTYLVSVHPMDRTFMFDLSERVSE